MRHSNKTEDNSRAFEQYREDNIQVSGWQHMASLHIEVQSCTSSSTFSVGAVRVHPTAPTYKEESVSNYDGLYYFVMIGGDGDEDYGGDGYWSPFAGPFCRASGQ
jgi:hypothetical protein